MATKQEGAEMTTMTKTRYPRLPALTVAQEIIDRLSPACERITIAGSLRREKQVVGDIELLYIPRMHQEPSPTDFFQSITVDDSALAIAHMLDAGILEKRLNVKGLPAFGPLNKLMRHIQSGIPVDLFATDEASWFNYLVCRTGPRELNERICNAAIHKGWHWAPYGRGFVKGAAVQPMESEEAVFAFVGLPFKEPRDRV
jgi:DNA polymerase/3'-5' exonuclease PolX